MKNGIKKNFSIFLPYLDIFNCFTQLHSPLCTFAHQLNLSQIEQKSPESNF